MAKKICISTTSFAEYSTKPLQLLRDAGFEVQVNPTGRKLTSAELVNFLHRAVGVLAGTESYPATTIDQLHELRVISRVGAGTDGIDRTCLEKKGIGLLNTPEVHVTAVAELTIAGLLALTRRILPNDKSVRTEWKKVMGEDLHGKVVGLIGFGKVGRAVAQRLIAMGCKLMVFDPFAETSVFPEVNRVSTLNDLLIASEAISLHVPLNQHTQNLIDRQAFPMLKHNVKILNTSRGGLINEADLYQFLVEHPESAAFVDVFENEPYNGPLTSLPNAVLTPHIGTFTRETRVKMETEAVNNLINYFNNL